MRRGLSRNRLRHAPFRPSREPPQTRAVIKGDCSANSTSSDRLKIEPRHKSDHKARPISSGHQFLERRGSLRCSSKKS